jgi:hypothetical protein
MIEVKANVLSGALPELKESCGAMILDLWLLVIDDDDHADGFRSSSPAGLLYFHVAGPTEKSGLVPGQLPTSRGSKAGKNVEEIHMATPSLRF